MKSIRTKTILLNVIAFGVAIVSTTLVSAFAISNLSHQGSEKILSLSCDSAKHNLNNYFKSVEQSVKIVSSIIDADLDSIDDATFDHDLAEHIEKSKIIFNRASINTNGVLTYYYRIDPEITARTNEEGYWYTNLDGNGFVEHEVTDISDDTNECVWFYTPKKSGQPTWLKPYVTDNLDEIVVSYNVPVFRRESFVGVVGIEISYNTLGEQIKDIKMFNSGFAFIVENDHGSIIYHPYYDILRMDEKDRPNMPDGFLELIKGENHHIQYEFQGVKKHAYWLELANGMTAVAAVPISEINAIWIDVVIQLVIVSFVALTLFVILTILQVNTITKPLKELTLVAEKINDGNYDVILDVTSNDEIGVLATTVNRLVKHLGEYIGDLNKQVYADALTSLKNRSAYNVALNEIDEQIKNNENVEFAIAIFDCDGLKDINDKYGHDKGNIYLKNASYIIESVFSFSDTYRLGGDEFAVILKGRDYKNREALRTHFIEKSNEVSSLAAEEWEKVRVSIGIAAYDPHVDHSTKDVIVHADHLMYENKRGRKKENSKNKL